MKYTLLGKTGMEISKVGFGGIPIQHLSQEKCNEVIAKALELGINFFDTARGYTVSESLLGNALKEKRAEVFLATKSPALDREGLLAAVEQSLKDLQTDYIDLYQLHNVKSVEDLHKAMGKGGAIEALQQLKDEGVVKHIGITSHKEAVILQALDEEIFETIQFPFSVVENQGEKAFKLAFEKGVGTIAMKPLAGGALRNGINAIRFILESPYLDVAIPGMDTVDQVIENAKAADAGSLTREERERLFEEAKALGKEFCRRCGYCLPCSEEIDIPSIFILEGYYTRYDLKDWALTRYTYLAKKAQDCIECGICETRCPYELPIMEMMKKVNEVFTQG